MSGATSTRTVVKARYEAVKGTRGRSGRTAVQRLHDNAKYLAHRPDHDGERQHRAGFNGACDVLEKRTVARFIDDGAKGEDARLAYRLILSPGEDLGERDLREWTRSVLERAGVREYVAFAHAGQSAHTEHPHVHVLTYRDGTFDVEALRELRTFGDDESDKHLAIRRAAELELTPERTAERQRGTEFGE